MTLVDTIVRAILQNTPPGVSLEIHDNSCVYFRGDGAAAYVDTLQQTYGRLFLKASTKVKGIPLHTSRRDRLVNCRGLPFTLAFCA
ncbi:hypothetical protein, partial [Burkholderia ubonensis]|uniref:hypothetical protein n=1 Tax=Burkholderia ubonensis TaxID=101571 RepID=UPI000A60D18A